MSDNEQSKYTWYPLPCCMLDFWPQRGSLKGFPIPNLQLVLASRSIITKRQKGKRTLRIDISFPMVGCSWVADFFYRSSLLLSCFIYQTLNILSSDSHLNPSGVGIAPMVLVPCLFHHSYWSTQSFSVYFPFAFSDLWLKKQKNLLLLSH